MSVYACALSGCVCRRCAACEECACGVEGCYAALRCAELGRQCWAEQCCVLRAEGWGKGAINVNMEGHTNPVFILY